MRNFLFMSVTATAPKEVSPPSGSQNLSRFRLIPRIETCLQVVAYAQTIPGKLVLLALFGLGLRFFASDIATVCRSWLLWD